MKQFVLFAFALSSAAYADEPSKTSAVKLDAVRVTADKERDFSLPLDSAPMTGSRLGLTNRDLPASISVITQEMMQLRGFRTAVEAVEGAVGMTGGTQFGSIPGYATRGFTANNVTILRDGIRQNTGSQSSRTIDSFLLDRVEVLKGPSSLLFGEGAIGGAVNYLSKSPDREYRADAQLSHGAWGTRRFGVGAGGPIIPDRLFFRADASYSETDGYVDRNGQRYTAFGAAVGWDATDALKLTLFSTYLEDWNESYYGNPVIYDAVDRWDPAAGGFKRLVTRANAATDRLVNPRVDASARRTNYNIQDNYVRAENSFHRLRAELTIQPAWELRNETYVSTQLLKWRNLESNLWNPVTQLIDRASFVHIYRDDVLVGNRTDLVLKGEFAGRPNRFLVGGYLERNDLTRGGTPFGLPTTLSSVQLHHPAVGVGPGNPDQFLKTARVVIETAAFYIEDALDLSSRLKLVTGLRRDAISIERNTLRTPTTQPSVFNKDYAPWTGRAGLVWSVGPKVNLYGSYSRAAEPVTQLVSLSVAQNDFSLQKGRQFEAGAKGSLWNERLDFTAAVYDIEKNDLLTSTLDPETGQRINQQIGAQISQGAELALAFSPDRQWRIEGNLAWNWKAEYKDFNENLGTGVISRAGNTPANVPEWVASAYLSRTFGRHWRIGAGPRYVAKRAANTANYIYTPGYTTLEASVTYARAHWRVTLRGRNLLGETYEEWATGNGLMQRLADPVSAEFSVKWMF